MKLLFENLVEMVSYGKLIQTSNYSRIFLSVFVFIMLGGLGLKCSNIIWWLRFVFKINLYIITYISEWGLKRCSFCIFFILFFSEKNLKDFEVWISKSIWVCDMPFDSLYFYVIISILLSIVLKILDIYSWSKLHKTVLTTSLLPSKRLYNLNFCSLTCNSEFSISSKTTS